MQPSAPTLDYITTNRALHEAVTGYAEKHGINYQLFSDDWIIRLQQGSRVHFVYGYKFDCNSQTADQIAADKVATYEILHAEKVSAVRHILLSSLVRPEIDELVIRELLENYGSIVVKPLRGGRGRNVMRLDSMSDKSKLDEVQGETEWTASPHIDIQREIRVVVYRGQIQLAYEKTDPVLRDNLKMFNVHLGANVSSLNLAELDESLKRMASQALNAIGMNLGAVDIVIDEQGRPFVLEINSGFSLEHYAAQSPRNREAVMNSYQVVLRDMFT